MKNEMKKIDSIAITIMRGLLFIYLGIGLGLLLGIIMAIIILENSSVFTIEDFRRLVSIYLPPIGVLLASQIAGFAVVRTIHNTNQLEFKKKIDDAEKSKKVLFAYFRHLESLGNDQIQSLNEFIKYINTIPFNQRLSDANIDKLLYDDNMNLIVFMNPIESMLAPDLHKYMDAEIMDYILNLKVQVVKMMQSMKLVKSVFIPSNERQGLISLLNTMKNNTQNILNSSKDIIEKISK